MPEHFQTKFLPGDLQVAEVAFVQTRNQNSTLLWKDIFSQEI